MGLFGCYKGVGEGEEGANGEIGHECKIVDLVGQGKEEGKGEHHEDVEGVDDWQNAFESCTALEIPDIHIS